MRRFVECRSGDGGGGVDPDGVTPLLLSAAAAIEILLVTYHFEPHFRAAKDTIGVDLSSESNNTIKPARFYNPI